MKCNCDKNIESLNQVVCSLGKKYDSDIHIRETILDKNELLSYMYETNDKRFFYGILSTGVGTTVDLKLMGDVDFQVVENTQIIELISEIGAIGAPQNVFFRGYELTVLGK